MRLRAADHGRSARDARRRHGDPLRDRSSAASAAPTYCPTGDAWLLVEFGGDSKGDVDEQAERFTEAVLRGVGGAAHDVKLYEDSDEIAQVWEIRDHRRLVGVAAGDLAEVGRDGRDRERERRRRQRR